MNPSKSQLDHGEHLESGAILYITKNRNVKLEPGEIYLLNCLRVAPLSGWSIFFQPHFNGERPDFVLTHPQYGIVIIEVKDYQIESGRYSQKDGNCFMKVDGKTPHMRKIENPCKQVERYKENILELYSRQYDLFAHTHGEEKSQGAIETVIYFHNASKESGIMFCGKQKHILIADRSMVDELKDGRFDQWIHDKLNNPVGLWGLRRSLGNRPSDFASFKEITENTSDWSTQAKKHNLLELLVNDLNTWLMPTDGAFTQLLPISIDAPLAQPAKGKHQRLKGVAGSGKTLVLAERAARLLANGQRVLILTYNITLSHYIRDRVNAQFQLYRNHEKAINVKDNLSIIHFHGFLKWIAQKHDHKLSPTENLPEEKLKMVLEIDWPKEVSNLHKYLKSCHLPIHDECIFDAILIDEAQDFKESWLITALDWCSEYDELFVVYDTAQDIYDRSSKIWLDSGTKLRFPPGRIPEYKETQRLPDSVTSAAQAFLRLYSDPENTIEHNQKTKKSILLYRCALDWENVSWTNESDLEAKMENASSVFHNKYRAHPNDVSILVRNERFGIPITKYFQLQRKFRVTHVFDLSGEKSHDTRRREKKRFQPNAGSLKVCTIHSFKGWEAPFVQIVIDPQFKRADAQLLYIAITRLKQLEHGGQGALRVLNFSRDFDAMKTEFEKANLLQPQESLFKT